MTTVQQVYSVRSFRSSKDRDFGKALRIYDEHTHPQLKTDAREIAHWLDQSSARHGGKFFVCGLYVGADLVGFVEFIYLTRERLIHFDYFIIDRDRRTAGAFHTFADQMRAFFEEEELHWDFVTAEVAEVNKVNGISKEAQMLVRVFRQVGFSEVLTDYRQPQLGLEHKDTTMPARLLVLPRVEMEALSKDRYLDLVAAIYHKHYGEWYSIYPETAASYRDTLDCLLESARANLRDKREVALRGPERDFADSKTATQPPLRDALQYVSKIAVSAIAAAGFHYLLRNHTDISFWWIAAVSLCAFALLAVVISLTDKKRLEAFKILVSLVSKLFDR